MPERTRAGKQDLGLFLDQHCTVQWKSMSQKKGNLNFSRSHNTKEKESGETSNSISFLYVMDVGSINELFHSVFEIGMYVFRLQPGWPD